MNKTININLGGIFFHIDEIAYQNLKNYLEAIRRSLSDDPKGRDEIITDIESRIGELLSEKVKDVRQVINEEDINEVVEIMGKPEDYMVDDEIFNDDNYTYGNRKKTKKLYRDGDDKFLGGVSSGMAHYLNMDVIWVRLAWLVAAFGFGFGFIVYPILWILLPQANSTSEKLEMEGEDVNISNIEKKIKDEISEASIRVKNGIEEVTDKVKNADYKKYKNKAKSGSQDLVDTLGKIISTFFLVIGKLIGVLLIIISVTTIIGLLIGLFTVGSLDFFNEGWLFQNGMVNNSGLPIVWVSILMFFLVGIPFFFLFTLGLRILSNNTKGIGKTANLSLVGIWIVALLIAVFFGTRQFMQTAYDGTVSESKELNISLTDTLHIKLIDNKNLTDNFALQRRWGSTIVFDGDTELVYSNNIRLNINPSESDDVVIKTRKKSEGMSRTVAREIAGNINYNFDLSDTDLILNGYFLSDRKNKIRDQRVYIDLYIPKDQIIYLDNSSESFLNYVDNIDNLSDDEMVNHYFKMTQNGLKCLDCSGLNSAEEKNSNANSFNMKIDEKGVHIEIKEDNNKSAEAKINEKGILIEKSIDSI